MNFETVIGLEVHVELNTNSKIFSPTSAHFGNEQNANTNVIDWSFPGVLPVLNKGVVDAGIKAALALNMDIHQHMHFDRKNYFYPDITVGLKCNWKMAQLRKLGLNVPTWKKTPVRTRTEQMDSLT